MTSDDRNPDQRFALIMAEMSYEPEPVVERAVDDDDPTVSAWNRGPLGIEATFPPPPERAPARSANELIRGDGLKCPRCELEAFEVFPITSSSVKVACLGCPPPALIYGLSVAANQLKTRRYRCGRCGNQPQVTMTLSEVNLHCRRCSQLTLHSIQEEPLKQDPPKQLSYSYSRGAGKMRRLAALVGGETTRAEDMTSRLVEKMREELGLEDFNTFATKTRKRNLDLRVAGNAVDWNRGTGRSWRGLLNALAECQVAETPSLWVKAVTQDHGYNLCATAADWRNRLGLDLPSSTIVPSDAAISEKLNRGVWRGATLYLDHSLNEVKFNPGIMYRP